jgi:type II secretory pathway pseudopilin PulG
MKRRDGHTLIELIAIIGVVSAIVGVAVTSLHMILEAEGASRERLQTRAAMTQLARQFRSDAHAAVSLAAVEEENASNAPSWQLELGPEHTVRYRLEDERLLRTETVSGNVRNRETFVLPEGSTASITLLPSEESKMVAIHVSPGPQAGAGSKAVRIEAWLGMDHRFSTPDKPQVTP